MQIALFRQRGQRIAFQRGRGQLFQDDGDFARLPLQRLVGIDAVVRRVLAETGTEQWLLPPAPRPEHAIGTGRRGCGHPQIDRAGRHPTDLRDGRRDVVFVQRLEAVQDNQRIHSAVGVGERTYRAGHDATRHRRSRPFNCARIGDLHPPGVDPDAQGGADAVRRALTDNRQRSAPAGEQDLLDHRIGKRGGHSPGGRSAHEAPPRSRLDMRMSTTPPKW